jgi:hypothetical protein
MIVRQNEQAAQVKVLDFGLAKMRPLDHELTETLNSVCATSRRCCPPNISSVTRDHDDVYELPAREGGG